MNILYIDHYVGSPEMGMEFRPYYFAKEWMKKNHKVRVIGGTYSHLRRKNPEIKKDFEIELVDGIEYQWIITGVYEGNGFQRAKTMFSFVHKLRKHSKKIVQEFRPDVVIGSSTYPLDAYAARKIAKKAHCKYVHEAHDLWPLTLTEIGGMSKSNPFVIVMGIAERYAYRKSDQVVSLLPFSYKHMLKHGLQSVDKYTFVPNGIVLDDWKNPTPLPEEHKAFFEKVKKEGKFVVEYVGGHALSNYLDLVVDAANKTRDDKEIVYVLIGTGVEKERLVQRIADEKLDNIFFLPPINKKSIPLALEEADALYISAMKTPLYVYGISMNKVYDYMMAKKPVIYGIDAPNSDILDAKCGIYFEPGNLEELVKTIYQMKNLNEKERKEMGERGQKWVLDHYEYSVLAQIFLNVLER